ncbi:Forkhead transcription factor HCM1 [Nakaseomyces bracarensis]|uniref:Forkhead transcription factor HCM1 n=1 Tax=Nakaseomyces bracarensis TaxID=273131 RepID=A0ABR4NZX2_9SACH
MDPEFMTTYNLNNSSPTNMYVSTSSYMKKRPIDDTLITPPKSTPSKSKFVSNIPSSTESNDDSRPLSPARSSPITTSKAKRQKTAGGARSNGTLTLEELFDSLQKRKDEDDNAKKPQYSYAVLICLAILQSPEGRLTLSQIYCWISVHFPYYRPKDASWQNSIRHNLSLNSAFTKTEKSSDGKGHFWQVKPGSESKFFKGDYGDYENLRKQIQTIERFFDIDPAMLEEFDNEKPTYLNREVSSDKPIEKKITQSFNSSAVSISESTNTSTRTTPDFKNSYVIPNPVFTVKVSSPEDDNIVNHNVHEFAKDDDSQFGSATKTQETSLLDPPYPMKKNDVPSELGTPRDSENTEKLPRLMDIHDPISLLNSLNSPPNMRRYMCSFNSNFDTDSPIQPKYDTHSLLGPMPIASPPVIGQQSTPFAQRYSNDHIHLKLPPLSSNILKTPEVNKISAEKTPARFTETPKDSNSILRKLQTPSHLFEDTYLSPMFRAMGTPLKFSATPNKNLPSSLSPRSQQIPGFQRATKFPSSGLFGVDIFSVLKRAQSKTPKKNDKPDDQ